MRGRKYLVSRENYFPVAQKKHNFHFHLLCSSAIGVFSSLQKCAVKGWHTDFGRTLCYFNKQSCAFYAFSVFNLQKLSCWFFLNSKVFVCHRQSKPATKAVRQKKRSSVLWSIKPKLGQWTHFKEACKEFSVEEVSKGLEMFNNSLCLVTVKMLCCRQLFFVFSVMSCYVVPLCKWCYNRIKIFPVFWQKPLDHWVPLHPIKIKTKR